MTIFTKLSRMSLAVLRATWLPAVLLLAFIPPLRNITREWVGWMFISVSYILLLKFVLEPFLTNKLGFFWSVVCCVTAFMFPLLYLSAKAGVL